MQKLIIEGGKRLVGEIYANGAKNSILPLLAATLLCSGTTIIHKCPRIKDVESAIDIMEHIGCKVRFVDNTIEVDTSGADKWEIPHNLMREMRSSVIFLGALMGRFGKAVISFPGGCELGPRPIDLHIDGLTKMNCVFEEEHGFLYGVTDGLLGKEIVLDFPSVGATENIMIAATTAMGITTIDNAAKEPEIEDLQDLLNKMGAKISGAGTSKIEITGVQTLYPTEHTAISDRIEIATYLTAAAVTKGDIIIRDINPLHLASVFSVIRDAGCYLDVRPDSVRIKSDGKLLPVKTIRTMPYPGFPTDVQSQVMAMLCFSKGNSVILESIFQNRFKHVSELCRMGAKIKIEGRMALVEGQGKLTGAQVIATDLRGGAALVTAALGAQGCSEIGEVRHIERGYQDIVKILSSVGADIKSL